MGAQSESSPILPLFDLWLSIICFFSIRIELPYISPLRYRTSVNLGFFLFGLSSHILLLFDIGLPINPLVSSNFSYTIISA
jgi:hypothetical protein